MSSALNNLFDLVCVINLDRRQDRWVQFQQDLPQDWPFRMPERFSAIDWRKAPAPDWWTAGGGAWGCYRSHLRLLEDALDRNADSVLIFEDDAVFAPRFNELAHRFILALPEDWEWIYLGGQHLKRFERLPTKINDAVYRPYNVNRFHAYALRGQRSMVRLYHHLLDHANWEAKHHIDHHVGKLHSRTKVGLYVPEKWLVGQREGKSNIAGNQQPRRFFRGAKSIVSPPVRKAVVAVVADRPDIANRAAELLERLGVDMGVSGKRDWQPQHTYRMPFEAPGLFHICSRLVANPSYELQQTFDERVSHLKGWAWKRESVCNENGRPIGGMHRDLCFLYREMRSAWPSLQVVVAVSSCENQSHDHSDLDAMRRSRSIASIKRLVGDELIELNFDSDLSNRGEQIDRLVRFLSLLPSEKDVLAAIDLLG